MTPPFNEIKVEVEEAWKRIEAHKLAEAKANELKKKADAAKGSLKERLTEYADKVIATNQFAWLSKGSFGEPQLKISSIEGVDGVTWDFMENVFTHREGELGVAKNGSKRRTTSFTSRAAFRPKKSNSNNSYSRIT